MILVLIVDLHSLCFKPFVEEDDEQPCQSVKARLEITRSDRRKRISHTYVDD